MNEIENEFLQAFFDAAEDVSLSEEEKAMLSRFPGLLLNVWNNSAKAILLHAWPSIMIAQLEKARNGDTTSAKFIAELIQPKEDELDTPLTYDHPKWEQLALALRDRLQLELSAQDFVVNLLTVLVEKEDAYINSLLLGDY